MAKAEMKNPRLVLSYECSVCEGVHFEGIDLSTLKQVFATEGGTHAVHVDRTQMKHLTCKGCGNQFQTEHRVTVQAKQEGQKND